jgi:tRNA A-37 threonylcarbamoyl transferase component Bud32
MTPDWERVTALFTAARVLAEPDRRAFLDLACGTDQSLRAEVDSLIDSDTADSFLETPRLGAERWNAARAGCLAPGCYLNGRYRIERPLGSGGQAFVYRAVDNLLSRAVVVKVMRAGHRNEWLQARFEREMQALSRIDHPGVVGILDVGALEDGSPFLVIQHVEGESLRTELGRGPLGAERAAGFVRQLGAALGAAHAAGVVHRDLKPENVMLQRTSDGAETIKLIDFGIAKIERSQLDAGVTTVMVAGTVRYMAPEQFHGENSPAADLYALALVVCEMLSGQPDARALPADQRPGIAHLIDAALALRPQDRPADVARWSEDVARALVEGPARRRKMVARAAAVAAVVLASAIGARVVLPYYVAPVRIVEKVGAFDPRQEGFLVHGTATGTVAVNAQRDGYDAWRAFGSTPSDYYYAPLTNAQKRLAMSRGWTLTAIVRAEEGATFAHADFTGYGRRYGVAVIREADMDRVLLQTQIVPATEGLDLRLPHVNGAYHRYELRYDPSLETASLWIDGTKRLDHFRGLTQFQEDTGLFFGAGPYMSDRGAGSFQSIRLEINP